MWRFLIYLYTPNTFCNMTRSAMIFILSCLKCIRWGMSRARLPHRRVVSTWNPINAVSNINYYEEFCFLMKSQHFYSLLHAAALDGGFSFPSHGAIYWEHARKLIRKDNFFCALVVYEPMPWIFSLKTFHLVS